MKHYLQRCHECTEESDWLHYGLEWHKRQQRVVDSALSIMDKALPTINGIYMGICLKKLASIIKDPSHSSYALFSLLPSDRRYGGLKLPPACAGTATLLQLSGSWTNQHNSNAISTLQYNRPPLPHRGFVFFSLLCFTSMSYSFFRLFFFVLPCSTFNFYV